MILLIYFIALLLFLYKDKSVSVFFLLILIISLIGSFFTGRDFPIDTLFKAFNVLITAFILTAIVVPWVGYNNVREITFDNELKLKKLTRFLLIISFFSFVVLLATAIIVFSMVSDINVFKYAEGVSTDFYYSLPFNVGAFILASFLFNFSYFLIPLHFYYLGKQKYKLSLLCFLFSLNIILYGLTYFSRAAFVHYAIVYLSFLILLYHTLNNKIKKFIKIVVFVLGIVFVSYFIYITNSRFATDTMYSDLIPEKSPVKDPAVYSYIDYMSQWYYNNMYLLNSYNYETFKGQTSLQPVLTYLGHFHIINWDYPTYYNLRCKIWPYHSNSFNGFVAYCIYDYGYIVSVIFVALYYFIVRSLRPLEDKISVKNLFYLVLLIQIPSFAIFYSVVSVIIITAIFLIPIIFYLKAKVDH